MSLPYTILGNVTGSLFSASFLNGTDTRLFSLPQIGDIWYGFSPNDVIEFSVFDTSDNILAWNVVNSDKTLKSVTLSYINELDIPKTYTFKELVREFVLYKNNEIMVDPILHLSASGFTEGSFKLSYLFTRYLAGDDHEPLVIKEISPSRKEIKLIPSKRNSVSYEAFCRKKFPIIDVSPVLISATQQCPYEQIYNRIKDQNQAAVNTLKSIFFLDDGTFLTFLKNLYEDFVKYTLLNQNQIDEGMEPTRISRIQGIRTYFSNWLLENNDMVADFDVIEDKFKYFVNYRLDQRFGPFKKQKGLTYVNARKFLYDFFVTYFYENITIPLKETYNNKYVSYLKNVLNFGNNRYFQILNHDYIDERASGSPSLSSIISPDPLTLLIKLSAELPNDIGTKDSCWVANCGMSPYVVTTILQNPVKYQSVKISPANFNAESPQITRRNTNKMYSSDDLALEDNVQNQVTINKAPTILNVDYSDFSNFIVFSSAEARTNIFKNKSKTWYQLSASMVELDRRQSASLASSAVYPYYLQEKDTLQTQMNDIADSFDGYESFLFGNPSYVYIPESGSFYSASYVTQQDEIAIEYDKTNRDYLVNNTPEYVINETKNEDYLTFLAMVGQHFDDIYLYISSLPIERNVQNQLSSSLPINTLKELLSSFGWNVEDFIGDLDVDEVYLNSLNAPSYNAISSEERLQIIWNRILVTLPGLYKTKGTEACVQYLLSCYGIPPQLLNIREYGGIDSSETDPPSCRIDENVYMLRYSGPNDYVEMPYPDNIHTVEFKFAVENPENYVDYKVNPLINCIPYPYSSASWAIEFMKVPGQYSGKVVFQLRSGSDYTALTSSDLPIFNGDVFSVMLRRNYPDPDFQTSTDDNVVPLQYDLYVQRNENGRQIFYSTASVILEHSGNIVFSQYGKLRAGNGAPNYTFVGTLDKIMLWDVPINDENFEDHVNDFQSYALSGSDPSHHLWVRTNYDYPQSFYDLVNNTSSAVWVQNAAPYYGIPKYRTGDLSSSLVPVLYSASLTLTTDRWRAHLPTGSNELIAWNFPEVVSWSSSFNTSSCAYYSASTFPYHFRNYTTSEEIDASQYGPNKFKNNKVRKIDYIVDCRLSADDRSTTLDNITISPDSNQIGLFVDPQDYKNKDIIRYIGDTGIMELISDPSNLYSDRYYDLIDKNIEYAKSANKRTYFNELITVYKFYFDKSVFNVIKNVMPARSNVLTGVIIEPTILERPKYQHKVISSSLNNINFPITGFRNFSATMLWGSPNTNSYQQTIDLSYLNDPNRDLSPNYVGYYMTDALDRIQLTAVPDGMEDYRLWDNIPYIYGSVNGKTTDDNLQITSSVDDSSSHRIVYYLLKVWEKYDRFIKSGSYSHTDNPRDNVYQSASTFLYKYVNVNESYFKQLVYFSNNPVEGNTDPSPEYFNGNFSHSLNTFKLTPNMIVSNIGALAGPWFDPGAITLTFSPTRQYFELVKNYPRNHYTHKMNQFSSDKHKYFVNNTTSSIYVKGRQTINSTISETGITDGTFPVQSFNVSNVNIVNNANVIQQ